MRNYRKHNDLISNFFFLIKKIENYKEKELYLEFQNSEKNTDDSSEKISSEEYLEYEFATELLQEIYIIFKLKYNSSIFEDYNHLLISRFIFPNWRILIKAEIYRNLSSKKTFSFFKNQILASLKEIQLRTDLDYTWDLYNDLDNGRFFKYCCHESNSTAFEIDDSGEFIEAQNLQPEYLYPKINTDISEDIKWIESLEEKDLVKKIKLSPKLTKSTIISLLNEIEEGKRKNYNKNIKSEIKKFIDFITDRNSLNVGNYNLSFLETKKDKKNFAKIFLLMQSKELILNKTKGELDKILADCLNIGTSTLGHITEKNLKDELEACASNESYLINELG